MRRILTPLVECWYKLKNQALLTAFGLRNNNVGDVFEAAGMAMSHDSEVFPNKPF
jgi:hypothetical protein